MKIKTKLRISFIALNLFCVLFVAVPIINLEHDAIVENLETIAGLKNLEVFNTTDNFFKTLESAVNATGSYIQSQKKVDRDAAENFFKSVVSKIETESMVYFSSIESTKTKDGYLYSDNHWQYGPDFDQTTRQWYKLATTKQGVQLSDPYVDAMSGNVIITLSGGVRTDGNLTGVAAIDSDLSLISVMIDGYKLSASGKSFIISSDGTYITNPETDKILKSNFFDEYGFKNFKNEFGTKDEICHVSAGKYYFTAKKLPAITNGWYYVTFGPKPEIFLSLFKSYTTILVMFILAIIIGILVAFVVSQTIVKPLNVLGDSINEIASGNADLTKRIQTKSRDEVAFVVEGFNRFVDKLQSIVSELKDSNGTLISAGNELTESTADTSRAIKEILSNIDSVHHQIQGQSESVEETAGAVNQIASNIASLENMIGNQSREVTQASSAVEEMIENIAQVNTAMEDMANSFEILQGEAQNGEKVQQNVNERIRFIEEQSRMLQEANTVISNIAEQTNLLAMNAAIEAAHAGEAGKGFSVVADEIRKLSETSSEQSKTIGQQLNGIKNSIADVVKSSEESSSAFNSVSAKISETDEIVKKIKSSMQEQYENSKQIGESLHTMNDSTKEVQTASNEMTQGNKAILEEIKLLQDATFVMKEKMQEMNAGAQQINSTGSTLESISSKMDYAITDINSQVEQFKV